MTEDERRHKINECKAIWRSTRSTLCPHGVRWRDCQDHEDRIVQGEVVSSTIEEEPA